MATEIKMNIIKIPRLVNKDNMNWILNGHSYKNLDSALGKFINKNISSKTCYITKRHMLDTHISIQDDDFIAEEIIGEVLGFDDYDVTCNIYDMIYYNSIENPRIRLSGKCIIDGDTITIVDIDRLSL